MASHGFRAFGFLLLSGALGGFCLTSGAAHYFPASTDRPDQGGGGEGGGSGGGGGKAASEHGGIEHEGKGVAVAVAAGSTTDGKVAPEKSGPIEDPEDASPLPAKTVLTENELVAFLAGNTIERESPDHETEHRYISRHAWQGDVDAAGHVTVHRWMARERELCLMGAEATVTCSAVAISRDRNPGKAIGARLGTVRVDDGPAWPVLRGNVAGLPEVMPLIDGMRRLRKGPPATTASAKGDDVLKALVGHPLVEEARDGEVTGVFYDPDGRWITTAPIAPGARSGLGGIRVSIGQWAVRDGKLCVDEPGMALTRKCFVPEQMGEAAFRLLPTQAGTPVALSVLAEGA